MDMGGGGGKESMGLIESVAMTIYTPSCVKQIASTKLLCSTGSSAWCL